jgi:hypothetical protein
MSVNYPKCLIRPLGFPVDPLWWGTPKKDGLIAFAVSSLSCLRVSNQRGTQVEFDLRVPVSKLSEEELLVLVHLKNSLSTYLKSA